MPDRVSAEGRTLLGAVAPDKIERLLLRLLRRDLRLFHPLEKSGPPMGVPAPLLHRAERFRIVMNGDGGAFGQNIELAVGNDRRDLYDAGPGRLQSGHLQIEPDQVHFTLHKAHISPPSISRINPYQSKCPVTINNHGRSVNVKPAPRNPVSRLILLLSGRSSMLNWSYEKHRSMVKAQRAGLAFRKCDSNPEKRRGDFP